MSTPWQTVGSLLFTPMCTLFGSCIKTRTTVYERGIKVNYQLHLLVVCWGPLVDTTQNCHLKHSSKYPKHTATAILGLWFTPVQKQHRDEFYRNRPDSMTGTKVAYILSCTFMVIHILQTVKYSWPLQYKLQHPNPNTPSIQKNVSVTYFWQLIDLGKGHQ